MAKFSQKVMGKEVGNADVYAPPHTMTGTSGVDLSNSGYGANHGSTAPQVNMSVGNINRDGYPGVKTSGIVVRGTRNQTKGKMARGPMA
jgi:hypothetical protein